MRRHGIGNGRSDINAQGRLFAHESGRIKSQLHQAPLTETDTSASSFFSSSDIIAAVLSISIDRTMYAELADPETPRWTFTAANLRCRMDPPLSDTYLGNMIYAAWNHIDCGQSRNIRTQDNDADLLHITQFASQVRTRIAQLNKITAYSCSARVVEGGNWYGAEGKPPNVVFTSWRHLSVTRFIFGPGLGYIERFEPGFALIPGACIMLPCRTRQVEQSATVPWEVSVTLMVGHYETLMRDRLLRQILADE